jgi:hypothetical protein
VLLKPGDQLGSHLILSDIKLHRCFNVNIPRALFLKNSDDLHLLQLFTTDSVCDVSRVKIVRGLSFQPSAPFIPSRGAAL